MTRPVGRVVVVGRGLEQESDHATLGGLAEEQVTAGVGRDDVPVPVDDQPGVGAVGGQQPFHDVLEGSEVVGRQVAFGVGRGEAGHLEQPVAFPQRDGECVAEPGHHLGAGA